MQVIAYAAHAASQPLEPWSFTLPELGPTDVRVEVTYCGICRSDVSFIDDMYKMATFPLVAGHEIIGVVKEKGAGVSHLAVGQRVGVGPMCGACLRCELCASGRDNLCAQRQLTIAGGNRGGFAQTVQLDGSFAFPIPDGLPSENAAPLLCAGVTVYAPLRQYTTPAASIGVIGIGGLGQLGLQFAAKRGNEVTALSTSVSKEEQARRLGAHRFVITRDAAQMRAAAGSLDFILSTVDASLDWSSYLSLLRPDGRICIVGGSLGLLGVPVVALIMAQHGFLGSAAGSRGAMQEMLRFSARHGIKADVEVVSAGELNAALERVRKNEAPTRLVLKH